MKTPVDKSGWIDISATISDGMVSWPTDEPVHIFKTEEIGVNSGVANVTAISTTAHVGTHIDAPLHFFANGKDISEIDLNILIGRAKVFNIKDKTKISYEEIKYLGIKQGDRVLFRTRNSEIDWERKPFFEDYIYLATDAAQYLADTGVQCVGVDYISIGGKENNPEVHRIILGKPIIIIEGLKLGNVAASEYDMVCLPLKIKGSDGGPSRVILRKRN
jgi:arylformamidase